jgi:tRNA 2-selenouridine synthase SelU
MEYRTKRESVETVCDAGGQMEKTVRVKANEQLVQEVQRLGGFKSKKQAATVALEEYIRILKGRMPVSARVPKRRNRGTK